MYLHFRSLHGELQENQPGKTTVRNSAMATVEHVMKWWLCRAGIPTKTANQLFTMALKMINDWTVLFKQRLKTMQLQLDERKAFLKEMKRTFWAPQPNYDERLNEEDRKFSENMKTSRESGVSSLNRKTAAKNKEKLQRSLQKQERIYKEEQRKINLATKSSNFATHFDESSENISLSESEEDNDMYVPTSSKRQKQQNKKRGTVSLKVDAKHWSELLV